ncbi:class I SAM-dependent methyltransferase [Dokdonella soli]|uniref:Methyltransferase type 11 domain-containing protein n=1 Tax=Dokdonella soli TaxID=529810 RepID=A0ABN1IHZ5_9GAMM
MSQSKKEGTSHEFDAESHLRSDWAARQHALGNVPQAVLLRNLPPRLNLLIDTWHRSLLRWSLAPLERTRSTWIADLGCGYGRVVNEVKAMGFENIIGLDYEAGFCRQYQLDHGHAVQGSIAQPPFAAGSLSGAYAITAFMYVGLERAIDGIGMLDASLSPGARILILEAGAEFNGLSRYIFRQKRTQSLAVNGFSRSELGKTLLPDGWRKIASGSNAGMTMLLPLLMTFHRWPRVFNALAKAAMHLDRPRVGFRDRGVRSFGLHRWVLCEKPFNSAPAR